VQHLKIEKTPFSTTVALAQQLRLFCIASLGLISRVTSADAPALRPPVATVPRRNSAVFRLPTRYEDDRPFSGWSMLKTELVDGLVHWTLHDFRRTYRRMHEKIGSPSHIAERLINQAGPVRTEVEALYDRWTYLPEMKKAMETYEVCFSELLVA
jgi:hypothetical protein